jgi:integral membrane protein
MPSPDRSTIGRIFTIVALIEAFTWAGLLVGMFLKYVTETTDAGVWLFGRLHGAAFIAYVLVTIVASRRLWWPGKTAVIALLAGVPPLATLIFERWASRAGRLQAPARDTATPAVPTTSKRGAAGSDFSR